MRLICPNCDAEYEVEGAAIPEGGRDVQCSNCGHGWFQLPPDVIAASEDEAALYDPAPGMAGAGAAEAPSVRAPVGAPVGAVETAAVEAAVEAAVGAAAVGSAAAGAAEAAAIEAAAVGAADDIVPAAPAALPAAAMMVVPDLPAAPEPEAPALTGRSLDENLMAVLREEAEREILARKTDAARLETQIEMPLTSGPGPATAAARKIARLRGEPEAQPPAMPRPRRELLPEIEEINSSLRASGEKRDVDQGAVAETMDAADAPRSGGFRRGFLTIMVLVILLAALYIAAPLLAARVPALAGPMAGYVEGVDAARVWLDGLARAITVRLSGLTGGQG